MLTVLPLRRDSTLIVAVPDRGMPRRVSALPLHPAYARVASVGDSTLVLAYVGAHPGPGESEHSSVFSRQSRDGGRTWSPYLRIHHSIDGSNAHWPELLMTGDGILFLMWAQQFRDGPDSVLAVQSSDSGTSWQRLASLSLPGHVHAFSATADAEGRIHVATAVVDSNVSIVSVYSWRRPAWSEDLAIHDGSEPISIAAVDQGTLYASWTVVHRLRDWEIPTTTIATLTLCHSSASKRR